MTSGLFQEISNKQKENIFNFFIAILKKNAIIRSKGDGDMSGFVDSYKKVFENKKAHLYILLVAFVWAILSMCYDANFNTSVNVKTNPVDMIFNIGIGLYSLNFLHNAIHNINNGALSSFRGFPVGAIWGYIKLNIVWAFYTFIVAVLCVVSYVWTHSFIAPIIVFTALLLISVFVNYFYIAFAEDYDFTDLWKLPLIFRFAKASWKETYIKAIIFILFSLAIAIAYIVAYCVLHLVGIDTMGLVFKDVYCLDVIMNTLAAYFVIITWYLAFPYSLISSYNRDIRPILREDFVYGENA